MKGGRECDCLGQEHFRLQKQPVRRLQDRSMLGRWEDQGGGCVAGAEWEMAEQSPARSER